MTPRPAPRRAATRRYTLTLRRRLPNEALLIEDLGARASGRRAQRIRALLLLGLDRDPPPNAFGHGAAAQAETGTLRVTVLIREIEPEDAVLRAALAQVGPLNVQEWLRDRLAAGLCGVDVPPRRRAGPSCPDTTAALVCTGHPLAGPVDHTSATVGRAGRGVERRRRRDPGGRDRRARFWSQPKSRGDRQGRCGPRRCW